MPRHRRIDSNDDNGSSESSVDRKHHRKDYNKNGNHDSDHDDSSVSSSSTVSTDYDKRRKKSKDRKRSKRHRERKKKKHKRKHSRDDRKKKHDKNNNDNGTSSSDSIIDNDSDNDSRHRSKRSSSSSRRHHNHHHRDDQRKDKKRRKKSSRHDHDSSDDDDSNVHRGKKRRKKIKKHKNKESSSSSSKTEDPLQRNHVVAQALHALLHNHPPMATELPIILIQLASGTELNLSQMTDSHAALGLERIFDSLSQFGVKQTEPKCWTWQSPPGNKDERILLRIIRTLLDDIGFTMEAIEEYETCKQNDTTQKSINQSTENVKNQSQNTNNNYDKLKEDIENIKNQANALLRQFSRKDSTMAKELAGLCEAILGGESISIDGLQDESLKDSLSTLFDQCGLEKSEMENDSDDDDDNDDDDDDDENKQEEPSEPILGYGIPEGDNNGTNNNDTTSLMARKMLEAVMETCHNPKRAVFGPMRGPPSQQGTPLPVAANIMESDPEEDDNDSDEGPAPLGAAVNARRRKEPYMSREMIQAQAEARSQQLQATATGITAATATKEGEREEWMIVPGKYDFLSGIKSGQGIKNRTFQNKKSSSNASGGDGEIMDPKVKAEVDAIMQAHAEARGPSLMDQHREEKELAKKAAAAAGGRKEWKWNRENDLDSGRRVDKDALKMVLGGAATGLQSKFQGGFGR